MAENIISSTTEIKDSDSSRTKWSELGIHAYIKMLIIGGLFYYLFRNEIVAIVQRWTYDSSWSHGFLIPLFSIYFINQRKKDILNLHTKPSYIGFFFLIATIAFYPLNIVHFQYGYFRPIGMIATLGAIVLFMGGWSLIRYTWLPVLYLIFAVPLPQRYYVAITMPMRILASNIASMLMNLVNEMEAVASGVIIDVVYKGQRLEPPLNVAEACSGMRLLMAFMALGVAMAYLHHRPFWHRIVLLVSTIPIAIFCNVIRVTVTGFIFVVGNPKYAQGIWHDGLGMVMLFLAFSLYGFLAWFMSNLFVEEPKEIVENIIVRRKR